MHGKTGSPKRKNRIALQGGTYAMAVTAIVFAILAAANVANTIAVTAIA